MERFFDKLSISVLTSVTKGEIVRNNRLVVIDVNLSYPNWSGYCNM